MTIQAEKNSTVLATNDVDPRHIDDYNYPFDGSESQQLKFLLNYAPLAPSHRNSQPWQFRIASERIEIYADPENSRHCADPRDRQKLISCGAALNVLEICAAYFGHYSQVDYCVDIGLHKLATFRLSEHCHATRKNTRLFHAIKRRQTNRRDYKKVATAKSLLKNCRLKAKEFGIAANFINEYNKRVEVARLVNFAIKELYSDPWYRREFAKSLRSGLGHAKEGVFNFEHLPLNISPLIAAPVIRNIDMSKKVATFFDNKICNATQTLLLISSEKDKPEDWLTSGRALNKILVYLESEGYTASYLNYPIEFARLRKQLAGAFQTDDVPQVLLRIGKADNVKYTGRHSASECAF